MTQSNNSSFGFWTSPLSAQNISSQSLGLSDLCVDGNRVYWLENRPAEKGRGVVVSCDDQGHYQDETPETVSVSAQVHGYGGGAFCVKDGFMYFSENKSGIVFCKDTKQNKTNALTQEGPYFYADFCPDATHTFIYCIRKNTSGTTSFPPTEVVRIHKDSGHVELLLSGADFYSNVRLSPNGKHMSWLQWQSPNMPWDATELWTASFTSDHALTHIEKRAGEAQESLFQPEWSPDNTLFVMSDRSNHWNLYQVEGTSLTPIFPYAAEFARPMWVAGSQTYAFISEHSVIATACEKGIWKTFFIDTQNKKGHALENIPLTCIYNLAANREKIAFVGGSPISPSSVSFLNTQNATSSLHTLRSSQSVTLDAQFISQPISISFPTENHEIAHAFYYPPQNPAYPSAGKPPLIVRIHGGPTACSDFIFNPKIQYYTTRGFAYVDVNYRGSTGYGRKYRESLKQRWGVADVEDAIACAKHLEKQGWIEGRRVAILGSSSGGFTVLSALTTQNYFSCASCLYGIADLVALGEQTHKFEAYYDQGLIGGSLSEAKELYKQRSPIYFANQVRCPIIFFHGEKDPVVHVSQSLKMAQAIKQTGMHCEVYTFAEEGHGFKKSENMISHLEKELSFFQKFLASV